MDKVAAERYLVAARDNPFVAAWLAVLDVHRLPLHAEVAGADWFDAFQELWLHELIEDHQFNDIDISQTFFGRRHPSSNELSDAMNNLRIIRALGEPGTKEPGMDFFERDEMALAIQQPAKPQRDIQIFEDDHRPAQRELQAFEEPSRALPAARPIEAFEPVPARRQAEFDARPYKEGAPDWNFECCSTKMVINLIDTDIADPNNDGGNEPLLQETVLHYECAVCGSQFHTSVSRPLSRDHFKE